MYSGNTILPSPPPGPSPVGTQRSSHLPISNPSASPRPGWSRSPFQAQPSPHFQTPHLGAAAQRAIGGAACDTPVQTLAHHAGASTPAFPNMVHEAPLLTALTRLCLAPGKDGMVTASWRRGPTQSHPQRAGLRAFLDLRLPIRKLGKSCGNVWSRRNPSLHWLL